MFWEQPCFTASPQEGVSSHQTAAAVVLVDARRKRDAQEEMLEAWPPWARVTTTAWLGKSFSLLLHQRGPGGRRTGDMQCLDPLMPGGARTGEPGGHHGSAPHCAAPVMSPSPHTACMVKRLHAQAPQGPTLSHSVTPLSKMTLTLVPTPLTPHMDHLLQYHRPCWSGVMLCSPYSRQQEPQPRCSLHAGRWMWNPMLAGQEQ